MLVGHTKGCTWLLQRIVNNYYYLYVLNEEWVEETVMEYSQDSFKAANYNLPLPVETFYLHFRCSIFMRLLI